ncbi:hypothetical protein D3C73_1454880 [compost metagenome]
MRGIGIKAVAAMQNLSGPGIANHGEVFGIDLPTTVSVDAEGFEGFLRAAGAEAYLQSSA